MNSANPGGIQNLSKTEASGKMAIFIGEDDKANAWAQDYITGYFKCKKQKT